MFCLNLKKSKSGHSKMRTPIILCLKAKGIRTAPLGNPYNFDKDLEYLKLSIDGYKRKNYNYYKTINRKIKHRLLEGKCEEKALIIGIMGTAQNIPLNVPVNTLFMGSVLGLDFGRNFEEMREGIEEMKEEFLDFEVCINEIGGYEVVLGLDCWRLKSRLNGWVMEKDIIY